MYMSEKKRFTYYKLNKQWGFFNVVFVGGEWGCLPQVQEEARGQLWSQLSPSTLHGF